MIMFLCPPDSVALSGSLRMEELPGGWAASPLILDIWLFRFLYRQVEGTSPVCVCVSKSAFYQQSEDMCGK